MITSLVDGNQFSTRRVIPLPDGFMRNHHADQHFSDIRKNDLVFITRRIAPRPLPPRDQGRTYDTKQRLRIDYQSSQKARDLQNIASYSLRPKDTRRERAKSYKAPVHKHGYQN